MSQYYKNKDNIYEFHPIGRCVNIYNRANILIARLILQTNRNKAMYWWNKIPKVTKLYLAEYYYKREPNTLTGREIEIIYQNVTIKY